MRSTAVVYAVPEQSAGVVFTCIFSVFAVENQGAAAEE